MSLDNWQVRFERLRCIGRLDYRQRGLLREVLQRFDSSEKSRFCSKTALPKCLTINDWLFCKIAKSERFFGEIEKLQLPLEHADLLLATKDHLQRVIGVDQSPLLLVLELVLLNVIPQLFWSAHPRQRR